MRVLTLNRPAQLNSFTAAMHADLGALSPEDRQRMAAARVRQMHARSLWQSHWAALMDMVRPADIAGIRPLARLGYYDYTSVTEVFEMRIPGASGAAADGLEGKGG